MLEVTGSKELFLHKTSDKALSGTVASIPTRDQIDVPVNRNSNRRVIFKIIRNMAFQLGVNS